MIIYSAINKINGHRYIGMTSVSLDLRLAGRSKDARFPFGRALRKYGLQSFEFSVIDSAEDWKTLAEKEIYWIAFYDCRVPNGYNVTAGGNRSPDWTGKHLSAEHKATLSAANKGQIPWILGKHHSEETKKKMSEAQLGKPRPTCGRKGRIVSTEMRARISASLKGRGTINPFAGKKHSAEARAKMSAWHKGKTLSEEHKRKIGLSGIGKRVGWKPSDETRARMSLSAKNRTDRTRKTDGTFVHVSPEPESVN